MYSRQTGQQMSAEQSPEKRIDDHDIRVDPDKPTSERLKEFEMDSSPAQKISVVQTTQSEKSRILVVEDDRDDYLFVESKLEYDPNCQLPKRAMHQITWVRSLRDALVRLEQEPFDVILLDLTLPDSKELEGLHKLRKRFANIPIVVLTSLDSENCGVEAIRLGAQDYLVKGSVDGGLARMIDHAIERHSVYQKLCDAEQHAYLASQTKSRFLAHMSHELRTPLTAIIGYNEVLLNSEVSPEEQQQALTSALKNSRHLLQIINDILDISKIEADKLDVQLEKVPLFTILEELSIALKLKAQEKAISFGFEYQFPLPKVIETDPLRFKQILFNLIGNAIKFTNVGGVKISVWFDSNNGQLIFEIVDTGVGISEERQQCLFEAFSQVGLGATRQFGGTGLGLVISRKLAVMLEGDITIESEKGRGTVATFSSSIGRISTDDLVYEIESEPPAQVAPQLHALGRGPLAGRILLAEDGPDNRELLIFLLKNQGADVVAVENGALAVERALNEEFDLLILDMQMPVMNGYEAAKTLRRRGYTKPILALTASAMSGSLDRCITSGCDDYMTKPFDRIALFRKIESYLNPTFSQSNMKFQMLEDDPEYLEVMSNFVGNLPKRVKAIQQAHAQSNWSALSMLAHRLKGAENFGCPTLSRLAEQLEAVSRSDEKSELNGIINKLEHACREVISSYHTSKSIVS